MNINGAWIVREKPSSSERQRASVYRREGGGAIEGGGRKRGNKLNSKGREAGKREGVMGERGESIYREGWVESFKNVHAKWSPVPRRL